jgi:hypothetical protein
MFHKKQKPDTDRDRLGRQRQPRTVDRTGTSSVFSYHASRSARSSSTGRIDPQAAPATTARNKRTGWLRRPAVLVGIGVSLVIVAINTGLTGVPQVRVDDTGTVPLRQPTAYVAAANSLLGTSVSDKNKLTINTARVSDRMRSQFPELERVTVTVPFVGSAPVVYVVPRKPVLLLNSRSELFVLDMAGRALIRANEVPNIEKLDLPVVLDGSGLAVSAGKPALPASNVSFITEVIDQLKAKGVTVTDINLPAGTSEMDIHISGAGYMVKFNLQGNGRVEAGAFLAVKAQLEREKKVPAEYIDVRVEDRAYYK